MKDKNLHPIFAEIMDNFTGKTAEPKEKKLDVFDNALQEMETLIAQKQAMYTGLYDLMELLMKPGNVSKDELMTIIKSTLKKSVE
jgi:hypothetical protein